MIGRPAVAMISTSPESVETWPVFVCFFLSLLTELTMMNTQCGSMEMYDDHDHDHDDYSDDADYDDGDSDDDDDKPLQAGQWG